MNVFEIIHAAKIQKDVTNCNGFQKMIKQPKMRFWFRGGHGLVIEVG